MTLTTSDTLTGRYDLDPAHTRIGFQARHAMVTKVRGEFPSFTASAFLDFEDPARSSADVTLDVVSIDTRNAQRDEHLRANDFLDAENHPQITFRSTAVEVVDDARFRMTGDLSIKGTTRPVAIDFALTGTAVDPFGNTRAGFEGSTTINRRDWGVSWNAALEAGGVLVSEKVTLEFDVSAIRVDAPA